MDWKFDRDRPICPQLCEKLCVMIASGELKPGEKLFSVREVALNAGVNPNTVQKSFEQLEQNQLIYSVRSTGWFVKEDIAPAKAIVAKLANEKTKNYFSSMANLGYNADETMNYVKEYRHE